MKVITSAVNNINFIEIQYNTLKKYLKADYEFIVFNDAKDFPDYSNYNNINIKKDIELICKKLNIECINIPNHHHINNNSSARRTADSMNYILKYQIENPDIYLLLDSDMFLIDYLDINKYINYDCSVVLQSRNNNNINYIWNGLYYFNMNSLNIEELNWNLVPYCDVGGNSQKWLKLQMGNNEFPLTDDLRWKNKENYNTQNIYFIKHLWSCSWDINELPINLKNNQKLIDFLNNDPRNKDSKYFCEIYDDCFLHYRAGGNWMEQGFKLHNDLSLKLKDILIDK